MESDMLYILSDKFWTIYIDHRFIASLYAVKFRRRFQRDQLTYYVDMYLLMSENLNTLFKCYKVVVLL